MIELIINILIILVNVSAVLNVLLILKVFFGTSIKLTNRILLFVGGLFFVVNIAIGIIPGMLPFLTLIVFAFMVVSIFVLSQEKRISNCFLAIPAALMYVQWGSMFKLVERLVGLDKFVYHMPEMDVTVSTILPDYILLAIMIILMNKVNKELLATKFTKAEGIIITIICIIYPVVVAFFNYLDGQINHVLFSPFWLIVMILINVAVIYSVAHRKKAAYYKKVANNQRQQFQAEYDYFKDYKENNVDIIKFRHDFNNHMLVIKGMFEKGQFDRANEYIEKLSAATGGLKKTYVTGHEILDMILKSKTAAMEEAGIDFSMEGNLTALDFMEDVDACILFSNIIDNAIEANLNVSESREIKRYIKLSVKTVNKMIYIQLSNPCGEDKDAKVNKTNGDVHGIGLQNVKEIVEKYEGQMDAEKEEEYVVKLCFGIK
ncbi:MAG: GHKL domain-containing protein [Lachnospiraceae bacterium]|nr:GHKL domain-containing protein [Lachnospiraceae bacterium]